MSDAPLWEREGRDWPNRETSLFVKAAGLRWHVQCAGTGPSLLLIHGTGAATHSWRGLLPLLATSYRVIAPDLPGHGFTQSPPPHRLSLRGMAHDLAELLAVLEETPVLAAGHSAGAAILARMSLDGDLDLAGLVSLNGALLPLTGFAGHAFQPLARLFVGLPFVPRFFAHRAADRTVVERLLRGTGSKPDRAGVEFYARLTGSPGHVGAALGMMANWDLRDLERDLHRLGAPLLLAVGGNDRTIPPREADRVRQLVLTAETVVMPGLGHLAHEEQPAEAFAVIDRFASGVLAPVNGGNVEEPRRSGGRR